MYELLSHCTLARLWIRFCKVELDYTVKGALEEKLCNVVGAFLFLKKMVQVDTGLNMDAYQR